MAHHKQNVSPLLHAAARRSAICKESLQGMRETRCGRKRRRQEAEEEARKAAGRRGDSKEGRQTGRQAAAEEGARRA